MGGSKHRAQGCRQDTGGPEKELEKGLWGACPVTEGLSLPHTNTAVKLRGPTREAWLHRNSQKGRKSSDSPPRLLDFLPKMGHREREVTFLWNL